MDDERFIRDGIVHYFDAVAAVLAFEERMKSRLSEVLRRRKLTEGDAKIERGSAQRWIYISSRAAFSHNGQTAYLQCGIGWALVGKQDNSARLYACFLCAPTAEPLPISGSPTAPYEIVNWKKYQLLCRRPSDDPVEDQLAAVIDELRRLSPEVLALPSGA